MASKVKFEQHPHRGNVSNKSLVLSSFRHLSLKLPHKVTGEQVYEVEIQQVIQQSWSDPPPGKKKTETTPSPSPWHHETKAGQSWMCTRRDLHCGRRVGIFQENPKQEEILIAKRVCSDPSITLAWPQQKDRQDTQSGVPRVVTMSLPTRFRFYIRRAKHCHPNVLYPHRSHSSAENNIGWAFSAKSSTRRTQLTHAKVREAVFCRRKVALNHESTDNSCHYVHIVFETTSLCRHGWPKTQTHHVARLAWISTASVSQVQGLKVCSTGFSICGKLLTRAS